LVLPEPPPAQAGVPARAACTPRRLLRHDGAHLPARGGLGAARRLRAPCGGPVAGTAARPRGRKIPRRVSRRSGTGHRSSLRPCTTAHFVAHAVGTGVLLEGNSAVMTTKIRSVLGRRIWDSRGRPTVEVEVELAGGVRGRGIAPAGASRGSHEAVDLRDGGSKLGGWGVDAALTSVNGPIADELCGLDAMDQGNVDRRLIDLDGTKTKSKLGGNATITTSLAVLDAAARTRGLPLWRHLAGDAAVHLPLPQIQIFGG